MVQHYGLSPAEQSEILASVKQGHYHVACTRIFEITHQKQGVKKGQGLDGRGETVTHPNRYFESSWKLAQAEGGADASEAAVRSSPEHESSSSPEALARTGSRCRCILPVCHSRRRHGRVVTLSLLSLYFRSLQYLFMHSRKRELTQSDTWPGPI